MVGQYIGETEFKMNNLLSRARGNILFIDEAYQLVEGGEKDFGRIVMNSSYGTWQGQSGHGSDSRRIHGSDEETSGKQ